ncbi:unnamed protein product [Notodromas monacha]|uniref:BACK domain-containing protein n=1 Tax=Notodromas monacha TaxID=399045 RepID=A0A7R9GL24_9CRUS|nr:unnamed protein product [Notodromas monacha]CAG0924480.1 unnamed protein product [Notodromas monacha]
MVQRLLGTFDLVVIDCSHVMEVDYTVIDCMLSNFGKLQKVYFVNVTEVLFAGLAQQTEFMIFRDKDEDWIQRDPNSSSPSATTPGIISHQQPAFRNNVPVASSLASSSGLPYSANSSRVSTPVLPTSGSISGSSYPRKAKISLDTFPADVLRAMFVEGREQCDHGKLVLKGISGSVMADFLRCLYTGEVFLSQSTVCQLLSAAVMFQVAPLLDACCTYLTSLLDSGNAIGIAAFAQRHGCEILHRHAVQFIERHFVSHSMEFLELPSPRVMEIIKSSNLNIAEERIVYDAVMRWVKHDEGTRTEKATALMKYLIPRPHYHPDKSLGQVHYHNDLPETVNFIFLHSAETDFGRQLGKVRESAVNTCQKPFYKTN